jgi:hypothetical protein
MSIFSRFLGKSDAGESGDGQLVANPKIEHPLSLQVLFPESCRLDSARLTKAFRSYHSSMSKVRCEIDPALSREGKVFGMIGWGKHVVRCVGFNLPMPAEAVEACVTPSHYPEELKQRARSHQAHVILFYAGYESEPAEQYVALAATAGVLARFGALVVLNESGRTSFPASALSGSDEDGDMMDLLRTLPLPILYCGFVKHEVEGIPGVWMRTYGAPLLGLPDIAAHAAGHHEGQRYFEMFNSVFDYLRESGAEIAAGHTMQIDEKVYLRFRLPKPKEAFLKGAGKVLVTEIIGPNEINR